MPTPLPAQGIGVRRLPPFADKELALFLPGLDIPDFAKLRRGMARAVYRFTHITHGRIEYLSHQNLFDRTKPPPLTCPPLLEG